MPDDLIGLFSLEHTSSSEIYDDLRKRVSPWNLNGIMVTVRHQTSSDMILVVYERKQKFRGLLVRKLMDDEVDGKTVPEFIDFCEGLAQDSRSKTRRADRLLIRIESWAPIKVREELLGDIWEDVQHRRRQGWSEKQLRRLIWWQFGYAIVGWAWGRAETVLKLIRGAGK